MEKNKLIEQDNKFVDDLISLQTKVELLSHELSEKIKYLLEKQTPEERQHFWCDGCNERIKPNERFIKFEVWKDHDEMWNNIVAETLEVYHTGCWYELVKGSMERKVCKK